MKDCLYRQRSTRNELELIQNRNKPAQIRLVRGDGDIKIEGHALNPAKAHRGASSDNELHPLVHKDAKNTNQVTLLRLPHKTISCSRGLRANRHLRTPIRRSQTAASTHPRSNYEQIH